MFLLTPRLVDLEGAPLRFDVPDGIVGNDAKWVSEKTAPAADPAPVAPAATDVLWAVRDHAPSAGL